MIKRHWPAWWLAINFGDSFAWKGTYLQTNTHHIKDLVNDKWTKFINSTPNLHPGRIRSTKSSHFIHLANKSPKKLSTVVLPNCSQHLLQFVMSNTMNLVQVMSRLTKNWLQRWSRAAMTDRCRQCNLLRIYMTVLHFKPGLANVPQRAFLNSL